MAKSGNLYAIIEADAGRYNTTERKEVCQQTFGGGASEVTNNDPSQNIPATTNLRFMLICRLLITGSGRHNTNKSNTMSVELKIV